MTVLKGVFAFKITVIFMILSCFSNSGALLKKTVSGAKKKRDGKRRGDSEESISLVIFCIILYT